MSRVSLDFPTVAHQPQRPSTVTMKAPRGHKFSGGFFFVNFPVVPSKVDLDIASSRWKSKWTI